jgi:hypothetical protein
VSVHTTSPGRATAIRAARGKTAAAFGRRCARLAALLLPQILRDILGRRALPAGRRGALGATPQFCHGLLALLTLTALLWGGSAAAQVVDRLVAIVGEQAITLSDVRAARTLGLVARSDDSTDEALVAKLVERELMRAEIERFGMPQPPADALEARVQGVRMRFATSTAWTAALDACGLSESRFRAWMADDWRIEQYLQQRFDAAAQPTDEEVLQYYQSREREFTVDGRPRSFEAVRDEARRRLTEARRRTLVDEWLTGLRRRTEIVTIPGKGL